MKIFKEVFIANIKELIRDRSGMFWLIAFPIIFVFIFGLIFTGNNGQQSYDIGLVFEGESPVNQTIERSIRSVPVFNVSINTEDKEMEALNAGNRELVMVVPEINPEDMQEYNIEVFYNNERSGAASILISSLREVFLNIERELTNQKELFNITSRAVQTESLSDFDYILPGILAMAIMQLGLFGSFQFLNLREKKIIRGLGVTPLPRQIILSSEILMRLLISLLQTVLIIFIGRWLFDVQIVSSLFKVFGIVLIGAFTFISLGYMLITFANSMESGRGIIQAVQFPMLFLSGVFFPIELMPAYIRPIVKFLPLTYLGNALREAMVGIPSGVAMSRNLIVLAIWSIITLMVTIKFWKWE